MALTGSGVMANIAAALQRIKRNKQGQAGQEPTPRADGQSPKKFAQPQPRPEPKPMRPRSTPQAQPARDIDRQRGETESEAERIRRDNAARRAAAAARRGSGYRR